MICIKKTKENYHQTHKPGSVPWDFAAHKMHHQHLPSPLGIELSKAIVQTHCPTKCKIFIFILTYLLLKEKKKINVNIVQL